jgi:hypothetical protein
VALYDLTDPGTLDRPALILALDGWVNAGSAGTGAAAALTGEAAIIATFDGDALFDYRLTRPTVDFEAGVMERVGWPRLDLFLLSLSRDLLVMTGTEPSWNWQRLGREVAELAHGLGVVESISIGGIPWAAPHTRPVTLITTASSPERVTGEHPEGLLRVPGAAVNVLEFAITAAGIPAVGFWARVPHYVGSSYHAASLALIERIGVHLGVDLPVGDLDVEAAEQREQLDGIVRGRVDLKKMVANLEELVDGEQEVSGEDLAAEIERFLRSQ